MRLKNCFATPTIDTLKKKLLKAKDCQKVLGIDYKYIPNKKWMVMMIGMLKPSDEIFAKDYVPLPVRTKKEEPNVISVT